jgi:hypothetical protein
MGSNKAVGYTIGRGSVRLSSKKIKVLLSRWHKLWKRTDVEIKWRGSETDKNDVACLYVERN